MTTRSAARACAAAVLLAIARPACAADRKPTPGPNVAHAPVSAPALLWVADGSFVHDATFKGWRLRPDCSYFLQPQQFGELRTDLGRLAKSEQAFLQEKDVFGSWDAAGALFTNVPDATDCWKLTITLGHRGGSPPRTSFVITAEPFQWSQMKALQGPTVCLTDVAGATPAFTPAFAAGGGPILDGPGCARLPAASGFQSPPPPLKPIGAPVRTP